MQQTFVVCFITRPNYVVFLRCAINTSSIYEQDKGINKQKLLIRVSHM